MAVSPSTYSSVIPDGFTHGCNYHFYDSDNNSYTPSYYQYLLSTAKKSIKIWDPFWIDPSELFSKVTQNELFIDFLCSVEDNFEKTTLEKHLDNLVNVLQTNGITKYEIHARCFYYKFKHSPNHWHDRYLILDDGLETARYFLVGASMQNQLASDRSYGIYEISNKAKDYCIIDKARNNYLNLCKENKPYPYKGIVTTKIAK